MNSNVPLLSPDKITRGKWLEGRLSPPCPSPFLLLPAHSLPLALTGQGSSQVSPSQPGLQEQEPSVGLQAAPLAQAQVSLQFRPHVPPGHGRAQSRPCHPEGRERGVCHLSIQAQHSFLPTLPSSVHGIPWVIICIPPRVDSSYKRRA